MSQKAQFSRGLRLSKPFEFDLVKKQGNGVSGTRLILAWGNNQHSKRRLGLVIPVAVGNAVMRNRIKRMIREHFRQNLTNYPIADIVIIAKRGAGRTATSELVSELEQLIKKAKQVIDKQCKKG